MNARAASGAQRARAAALLVVHVRALREGLDYLRGNALASLLGVAVMAIALGLPALFDALLVNQRALLADWGREPAVSVFLDPLVDAATAQALAAELGRDPEIATVEFIDAATALAEFRAAVGLHGGGLPQDNPLPHLLEVTPRAEVWVGDRAAGLVARLQAMGEVEQVLVDRDWVARLTALGVLAARAVWLLAGVLVTATVLIVANTIRVLVQQQAETIEVLRLVGATDAYVRRPFLYCGALHGLLAGALALALVAACGAALAGPVAAVAEAYQSNFRLSGLPAAHTAGIAVAALLCGWVGAFIGTTVSLRRLDLAAAG